MLEYAYKSLFQENRVSVREVLLLLADVATHAVARMDRKSPPQHVQKMRLEGLRSRLEGVDLQELSMEVEGQLMWKQLLDGARLALELKAPSEVKVKRSVGRPPRLAKDLIYEDNGAATLDNARFHLYHLANSVLWSSARRVFLEAEDAGVPTDTIAAVGASFAWKGSNRLLASALKNPETAADAKEHLKQVADVITHLQIAARKGPTALRQVFGLPEVQQVTAPTPTHVPE